MELNSSYLEKKRFKDSGYTSYLQYFSYFCAIPFSCTLVLSIYVGYVISLFKTVLLVMEYMQSVLNLCEGKVKERICLPLLFYFVVFLSNATSVNPWSQY